MKPTEDQILCARKCANVQEGVKDLMRQGMRSEGAAIKLIAQQNPKAYNEWRRSPPQPKARSLATSKFRFSGV